MADLYQKAGRRGALVWLLALICACQPDGCSPGGGDGGMPDADIDAGPDADMDGGGPDADLDASSDAEMDGNVDAGPDGAVDGSADAAPDAPMDGGACGPATCVPSGECVAAACVADMCVETPIADGTECGELVGGMTTGLCMAGLCIPRGCGDGFREPGPVPAREGCDDGNLLEGDACSPMCEPAVLVVSSVEGGEDWPAGPAPSVGVDGSGEALFVWSALRLADPTVPGSEPTQAILARPTTAPGVPRRDMDDPLVLDPDVGAGWIATPTVVGRPEGGWVVSWTGPDDRGDVVRLDVGSVVYREVAPTLAMGPVRFVNGDLRGLQHQPRVAASSNLLAFAWRDESAALIGPPGHSEIHMSLVTGAALACDTEQVVSTTAGDQQQPAIAISGSVILVTWTDAGMFPPLLDEVPLIVGRRFGLDGCAIDATPFRVSDFPDGFLEPGELGPSGLESSVAALDTGDFVVAWVDRTSDARGDVRARTVAGVGAPVDAMPSLAVATTLNTSERAPSVTPDGTGDSFLVSYAYGAPSASLLRDVDVITFGDPLPPEAAFLAELLTTGAIVQDAAITRTVDGTWVTFSHDGALGTPGAFRSYLAYLLPRN